MNGNQKMALDILGYVPQGYVCCAPTSTLVRHHGKVLTVGQISSYDDLLGGVKACVLLDRQLNVVKLGGV
mgnify:CR=1 FL=1